MVSDNKKILLTPEGLKKLKEEYRDLVENRRPEVVERIQSARDMGDLSENAAYHTAKEEQAFIEGRILELKQILKNTQVVERRDNNGVVTVGSKVVINIKSKEESFWIVGVFEADPAQKKISYESPLGQALIGKRVGDVVEVEAPVGTVRYKIVGIK